MHRGLEVVLLVQRRFTQTFQLQRLVDERIDRGVPAFNDFLNAARIRVRQEIVQKAFQMNRLFLELAGVRRLFLLRVNTGRGIQDQHKREEKRREEVSHGQLTFFHSYGTSSNSHENTARALHWSGKRPPRGTFHNIFLHGCLASSSYSPRLPARRSSGGRSRS